MARSGSSPLEDIDEKFCQCSKCLLQYREPKLLPCFHRYCSDCLKQLTERNQGATVISCPECRHEVAIPSEGVDGFKTDFYMKNIIEYIQIQESLVDEKLRECYGCSKRLNPTSYCFKCTGFLCKECNEYHMISKSLKEHMQHVLTMEDLKSQHMTLEKLSDLKGAPRCQSHRNNLCLFCCRTCKELPICMSCVHGMHKNHDINDVEMVAADEKEKLKLEMKNLNQCKEQILKMPQTVKKVEGDITSNFREKRENFTTRYKRDMQNVKREIENIKEGFERSQTEIENNKEKALTETKKQMEEEMKEIKIKYDKIFDEIEKKRRVELENLTKDKEGKMSKGREQLEILERELKRSIGTFAKKQEEGLAKLEEISQQIIGTVRRYERLKATENSILEIRNGWTAVQCIPDICKDIELLVKDTKKEFPELDKLSTIGFFNEIEEDEESPVNIEGIETDRWNILGITGVDDVGIVITGSNSLGNYQSHITVVKMNGKVLHREKLKGSTHLYSHRYCAHLSESKIATVCVPDEIGVFDICDYSYTKKDISHHINTWSSDVNCLSPDAVNNQILVGRYKSKDLYVFDDQLNCHHTLALPKVIKYPRDVAFSEGKLVICDSVNKRACVVTVKGQVGKVTHELTKPDCDRGDWDPLSVCTDSNGFIYILWMTGSSPTAGRRVIVQYTQDGSQSLTQKEIDIKDARCIATVKRSNTEKLLVATLNSGKLHFYTIM